MLAGPSCSASLPVTPPRNQRVVLVHGFLETGSTFKMLRTRLEKRGFEVYVPRLRHADARGGLGNLAVHLKQDIDAKFGLTAPLSIVAFSMGGLVSRQYLQNLGGAVRCENFITISSPHHGTHAAWLYPTLGAKEMRPGSQFLADLQRTEDRLGKIPVTSYRTPLDLIILPPASSVWDRAENLGFSVILHPLMLTSSRVLADARAAAGENERLPSIKNPAHRSAASGADSADGLAVGVDFSKHFDSHHRDSALDEAKSLGGTDGEVDDAAFYIGAAVVDGDHLGLAVRLIDHPHLGSHWQGFVGGGGSSVRQPLTACRAGAVVRPDRVPRGFTVLDGFHRELRVGRIGLMFGVSIPSCRATGNKDDAGDCQGHGF